MNWTVILTALIVFALFAGPFYLISRKHGSNPPVDEVADTTKEKGISMKHSGRKGTVTRE